MRPKKRNYLRPRSSTSSRENRLYPLRSPTAGQKNPKVCKEKTKKKSEKESPVAVLRDRPAGKQAAKGRKNQPTLRGEKLLLNPPPEKEPSPRQGRINFGRETRRKASSLSRKNIS